MTKQHYFMMTKRIGFSTWALNDQDLAEKLWGDEDVSKYLCSNGVFSKEEVHQRLLMEIENNQEKHIQYWPIYDIHTDAFLGCCGLRPFGLDENIYELGCHLCKEFWGHGYATEACEKVLEYACKELEIAELIAGHHPENEASKKMLTKLGFQFFGEKYYEPTGKYHPAYIYKQAK